MRRNDPDLGPAVLLLLIVFAMGAVFGAAFGYLTRMAF